MVHDAREHQCIAEVEERDPDRPFQGMGFLVGRGKCHQAGNVERRGKHECQCFRRGNGLGHRGAEHGCIGRRGLGVEGRIEQRIVPHEDRIERAEDSFLRKCAADECHEGLPAHAEEPRHRFNECADPVQQTVVHIPVLAERENIEQKQAGEDLSKFADNIAKYGGDMEGENTLKAAMLRMAGRLGDVAKDSPVEAGSYLQGNTLVSDQLLNSVRYVNEKVAEAEKDGQIPSSENMLSWGKEGFMQSALQTAADVGGKAVAAAQEQHAAKANGSDQTYDRFAAAQELEDSLEKPDNGNTVDLDSL